MPIIRKIFYNIGSTFRSREVLIAALIAACIALPLQANAAFFGLVNVSEIISNILLGIASLIGRLVVLVIDILIGIVTYNDFINADAVVKGWEMVRDICNMFFVLILLVIAFGTILRIENYKYNRLLGKLVLMAILINFSRAIAGFFIDVSQVIMLTFVNAFADTAAGNFASVLKLKEMLNFSKSTSDIGSAPTTFELIGFPLLVIVLLLIALMTLLAMVVVFLIRIIMLWMLVVLSPLAYLLASFPLTQKYSSQWWSKFGQWATTGPVLAFFLWLALAVAVGDNSGVVAKNSSDVVMQGTTVTAGIGEIATSGNILGFMLAVGMFLMALSMASALGGVAGSFAGRMSGRIKSYGAKTAFAPFVGAKKMATGLAGYGERQLYRNTGLGLDPRRLIRGIKADFAKRRGQDETEGHTKAADGLTKGGLMGTIKGLTGDSEDFSNRNLRGFLGYKGWLGEKMGGKRRFGRVFRSVVGGEEKVKEIRDHIAEENEKLELASQATANRVSTDKKRNQAQELIDAQANAEMLQRAIDTGEVNIAHLPLAQAQLETTEKELSELPKKGSSSYKELNDEEREKIDQQRTALEGKKIKIEELMNNIDGGYDNVITDTKKFVGELEETRNNILKRAQEANKNGNFDEERRLLGQAKKQERTIKDLRSAIRDLTENKGDTQTILSKGSLKQIAEAFRKSADEKKDIRDAGLRDRLQRSARAVEKLSDIYATKQSLTTAKGQLAGAMSKQQIAHHQGDAAAEQQANLDIKKWQSVVDKFQKELDDRAPSVEISPELAPSWREQLTKQLSRTQRELDKNNKDSLAFKFTLKPISKEEAKAIEERKEAINKRIKELESDVVAYRGPQAFEALAKRRAAIMEAHKKIANTTNEDELITTMEDAVATGDTMLAAAVAIQAARTNHWNEILNASHTDDLSQYIDPNTGKYKSKTPWGEDIDKVHVPVDRGGTYTSSQAGTNAFVRDVFIKKMRMAEQSAYALQNDVSNILENVNGWFAGQSVGNRDGLFYQRPAKEQQMRVMVEMSKRDEEKLLREGNRLAWTTETWKDPHDHSKGRVSYINPVGIWKYATKYGSISNNLPRARYNKNMAMNAMSEHNWEVLTEIMKTKTGQDKKKFQKFMKEMKKYAGSAAKEASNDIGSQVDAYFATAQSIEAKISNPFKSETV